MTCPFTMCRENKAMHNLIRSFVLGSSIVLAACSSTPEPLAPTTVEIAKPPAEQVKWVHVDNALEQATAKDKMAFILFTQDGCKYCQDLLKNTLTDPLVVRVLNDHFVSTRVKNADAGYVLKELGLDPVVPTILVVSPKTGFKATSVGFVSAKDLGSSLMTCVAFNKSLSAGKISFSDEESDKQL